MKSLKDIYREFLSLFNFPYISEEILKELKGPILLHISDTPVDIYDYIFRIINIIKPQYVIHTGDMADNIKLGIYKNKIDCYSRGVTKLIEGLEKNEFSKIYYVLGNHDDYETVSQLTKRGTILEDGLLTIEDCKITVGHYYKEYFYEADFNLYGHTIEPGHYKKNKTVCLNGVLNINIIDLSNKNVFHLEYPVGTNESRGVVLKRIGL
ncbi:MULTISPECIES: metallophosphoesterase [unclassified Sedimentibacter]|uniref:metallophosphoesterase n=1 Tax=unclassified Sedimentibacter TaxID=2649220 RepID=UPI0027DEDA12|nr:metallophosphoesterase [Sedimentibacter sp. MB35-C1]WMJ77337.1 metallophosphoesterase [Sedimentibacter sp. MB35-C1]